jgi:hypothetical protein
MLRLGKRGALGPEQSEHVLSSPAFSSACLRALENALLRIDSAQRPTCGRRDAARVILIPSALFGTLDLPTYLLTYRLPRANATPWRQAWAALLLSIVLLVASLGLTISYLS